MPGCINSKVFQPPEGTLPGASAQVSCSAYRTAFQLEMTHHGN